MATRGTRILLFLPFFHQDGCLLTSISLVSGSTTIIMRKFNFVDMLRALPLVPPVAIQLCKNPIVDDYQLCLEFILSNAASLGPEIMEQLEEKLNCTVEQAYGMTEGSCITHHTPREQCRQKHGSIGLTLPYWDVKVTDPVTGRTVGPNESGEICAKGPMLMKGYRGNPGSTAATIDQEGWLHTGDIGFYDKGGWFYITDRMKELIKYKGFQVSPNELEHLLLTHPGVADAAVVGIPDPEAGELPRAFVVVRSGATVTKEQLHDLVAEHAAPYKKLRGGIVFVSSIPKSPSGKILRRELRNLQQCLFH